MVAGRRGRAVAGLSAALLGGLGLLCAAPAAAPAQPGPRTLRARPRPTLGFSDLVAAQERTRLGGATLPASEGAESLEPAVAVILARGEVDLWDQPVLPLAGGRPAAADRGRGVPTGLPRLEAALGPALAAEAARRRREDEPRLPRVLFVADRQLPWGTLVLAATSAVRAGQPAAPGLALAVRDRAGSLGQVPLYVAPPRTLRVHPSANPVLLHVTIEPSGRFTVRARTDWLPAPESFAAPRALFELVGELKARDTGKSVVFLSAPEGAPLERVLAVLGPLRALYPHVALGAPPRVTGLAE